MRVVQMDTNCYCVDLLCSQGAEATEQGKGIIGATVDTVAGVAGAVVNKAGEIVHGTTDFIGGTAQVKLDF
jgi:hypothetical protein